MLWRENLVNKQICKLPLAYLDNLAYYGSTSSYNRKQVSSLTIPKYCLQV